VLGVPHPPGTPLFVLLGNVWGGIVRVGAYAWRLNLMSACFSAAGAGCLFLVAHRLLQGEAPWLRIGGAAAAAILSAFTFTEWQNSNETEVYTVATFSIAAICWLCLRWRDVRGTPRASHILLLIVYIAALSIGNHLLALLVGPAVSLFIAYTLRTQPAADHAERDMEWAEWATLTALWFVLVAVGLGSTPLLVVGGVLVAAAIVACLMTGSRAFPVIAMVAAAAGVSIYAFLYIRAGLHPVLNEADPRTGATCSRSSGVSNSAAAVSSTIRCSIPVRTIPAGRSRCSDNSSSTSSNTARGNGVARCLRRSWWASRCCSFRSVCSDSSSRAAAIGALRSCSARSGW